MSVQHRHIWGICILLLGLVLEAPGQGRFIRTPALPEDQLKSGSLFLRTFAPVAEATRESVVEVRLDDRTVALGTVISSSGLVLTKASEVAREGSLVCRLADGREVGAEVIEIDDDNDVALIRVDAEGLRPIEWAADEVSIGQWMVTPGIAAVPEAVGIVSVTPRRIMHRRAFIGVGLGGVRVETVEPGHETEEAGVKPGDFILSVNDVSVSSAEDWTSTLRRFRDSRTVRLGVWRDGDGLDVRVDREVLSGVQVAELSSVRIASIMPSLGAERAGLRPGDFILSVDASPVSTNEQLTSTLRKYRAGQTVKLGIHRNGEEFEVAVEMIVPGTPGRQERMNQMGSEVSARAEGFARAIQHDTVLQPWQCGGPIVNLDGKALGLNIARAGRVASYALPSDLVREISGNLQGRLQTRVKFEEAVTDSGD